MTDPAKNRPVTNSRGQYQKTRDLSETIVDVLATYPDLSMSTRQIYYQCVSRGVVPNSVAGYDKVQRLVVLLRRSGEIPYERVVDRTRSKHQHRGWDGVEQVLQTFGVGFRRDMWASQDTIIMIGLEKQALEGVFAEVVDEYGASLWTLHGYGSESFLFEWATEIKQFVEYEEKEVSIFYFGDHDPTGLDIERATIESLYEHGARFSWARSGLLASDFSTFDLINVPVKTTDTRAKKYLSMYGDMAAELDALPPDELQKRIRACIDNHIDHEERARLLRTEAAQRESLQIVANNWDAAVAGAKGAA